MTPGSASPRRWQRRRTTPPALRLLIGLVLLVVVGTLLLLLPGITTGPRLSFNTALFTATSALSVTGLSVIAPGRDLTLFGQIVLVMLIQVGGIGFMVLAVVLFRLIGRRISLMDRLALTDSFGLLEPRAIIALSRRVLIGVLLIEGVGAVLLWLHWRDVIGPERAVFYAIFHAVSSFCNAGFDLFGGLPEYPGGLPNDEITLLIMGSLIVLGGLGIPVLAELFTWYTSRRLSLHSRVTLVMVAVLIVAGWFGLWLAEVPGGGVLAGESWHRQLVLSLFQSISARTAGFAALPVFEAMSPGAQLTMMVLMFIGCAPASMGGGITTGTAAVLLLALWGYARGRSSPVVSGREISVTLVQRAAAVVTVSLIVVLAATWLILLTHDTTLDQALFEVVSAFATCGLTLAFTSDLNLFGQLVIILVMIWGRLGALTIVIALAQQHRVEPVSYPEEQLLIG